MDIIWFLFVSNDRCCSFLVSKRWSRAFFRGIAENRPCCFVDSSIRFSVFIFVSVSGSLVLFNFRVLDMYFLFCGPLVRSKM